MHRSINRLVNRDICSFEIVQKIHIFFCIYADLFQRKDTIWQAKLGNVSAKKSEGMNITFVCLLYCSTSYLSALTQAKLWTMDINNLDSCNCQEQSCWDVILSCIT